MITAFCLLAYFFSSRNKNLPKGIAYATIIFVAYLYVVTEILSLFSGIYTGSLWCSWILLDAFLLFLCIKSVGFNVKWGTFLSSIRSNRLLLFFAVFSVVVCFISIKLCPYNFDSMIYHLSRVFRWYHNHSVDYYPTAMYNQLVSPVLGSYAHLHVYSLLGGSDRAVNLVQTASYLLSGYFVYALVRRFDLSRAWGIFSTILFFTTRIVFMECFTTQVDVFSSIWVLIFVYLLQDFLDMDSPLMFNVDSRREILMLGLTVTLGYLAKPYVGIPVLFFVLGLVFVCIKRKDSLKIIFSYISMLIPVFVLGVLPGLVRNKYYCGSFSIEEVGARQIVGTIKPNYVFINGLKNYTYNLPIHWFRNLENMIYSLCTNLAKGLNVDIEDPIISEGGAEYLRYNSDLITCDQSSNPIIGWLFTICLAWGIIYLIRNKIKKKKVENISKLLYCICSSVSFLSFCLILRYEEYVARYMIAFFALLCPMIALFFNSVLKAEETRKCFRAVVYCLCSIELVILVNSLSPFLQLSRNEGYFGFNQGDPYWAYQDMLEDLSEFEDAKLGIHTWGTGFIYPYLQTTTDYFDEVKDVNITDRYIAKFEDLSYIPDAIISFTRENREEMDCHGQEYYLYKTYVDGYGLYLKKEEG